MYKVRAWAHDTAHKSKFNPWSDHDDEKVAQTTNDQPPNGEPEKDKPKKPFFRVFIDNCKTILFRSWINVLLIFVPAGIIVHFVGINPNVVFALNAVAVIPLAGLLTFATECVAHRVGPTLGALMNVSFGNAVELIIFIIALVKNEIRIVQASLIGSILANLLLILGMSMTIGGLKYQEQIYDSMVTQMSASLLALSSLSLLIPTAFHASFNDQILADEAVIKISRGTSVILLIIYVLYLLFQLKSHAYLYQGTPQHVIDEQTQPGILRRMDSTSSSSSSTSRSSSISTISTGASGSKRRRMKRKIQSKLGRRRSIKTEEDVIQEEEEFSGDGPGPLPSEKGKVLDKDTVEEPTQMSGGMMDPSATVASNVANPNPPAHSHSAPNSTSRRPILNTRAISIRAPPVFRAPSGMSPAQPANFQRYPATQLRRFNSTPDMPSSGAASAPEGFAPRAPARTATGLTRRSNKELALAPMERPSDEPPISQAVAIILLLVSTGFVALCAEFLVGSIEHLVESSPLSEAFIGLIILPIVGNAAEHVTAVVVASKNKLDLALGVSLGSSIQIALFITPIVIIIGWIMDKGMSLYFTLFETVALFVSVFTICTLCLDGRSNYLEGALLCSAYIIIAVGAYFFPDGQGQNTFTGGTAGNG